jgi:hypothetical protein
MKAKTTFSVELKSGYGQYNLVKRTATGKTTKFHITDSELYDDYKSGKPVQSRLKRLFDSMNY